MRTTFPQAAHGDPVRDVGRTMARENLDLLPIVGDAGELVGVVSERALARRYIRESRETSRLDAPTAVRAIVDVLEGDLLVGEPEREVTGRVWVLAMATESLPTGFGPGDVVVVGDRPDAQRIAIDVGVAVLVTSNGTAPPDDVLEAAREHGAAVIRLQPRQLRLWPHDHALLAVPRADGPRAADRAARRPAGRHHRRGQGRRLPGRGGAGRDPQAGRSRHALGPGRPGAAARAARRPRRAGPERRRRSTRRRSSRSSTTTTSARSRPASRCARRSIPSARRPRWWSSASARTGWSRAARRRRCCSAPCCRTR